MRSTVIQSDLVHDWWNKQLTDDYVGELRSNGMHIRKENSNNNGESIHELKHNVREGGCGRCICSNSSMSKARCCYVRKVACGEWFVP